MAKDVPDAFPPQFFGKNYSPHGFFTIGCRTVSRRSSSRSRFSLVTDDFTFHSTFHHTKKHSLYSTVELVVFRP